MFKISKRNFSKSYSIFGAGPSGLWTTLRLSQGRKGAGGSDNFPQKGDKITLYDPTRYAFSEAQDPKYKKGDRVPGGRICTFYADQGEGNNGNWAQFKNNSSAEMGGMRYIRWEKNTEESIPHRCVTHLIDKYDLDGKTFNTTSEPLYYVNGEHYWEGHMSDRGDDFQKAYGDMLSGNVERYRKEHGIKDGEKGTLTRNQREKFYNECTYQFKTPEDTHHRVYEDGTLLKNIGFWNMVMAEPGIGGTGYDYLLKTAGYNAFLINYNAASAMIRNNEFAPGSTTFRSIKGGFSILFDKMFPEIEQNCIKNGIEFEYKSGHKLISIYAKNEEGNETKVGYTVGGHGDSWVDDGKKYTADHAFLCMPRHALQQVADTTKENKNGEQYYVLNNEDVQLKLDSVISQPSLKVGAFFEEPWYNNLPGKYPLKIDDTTPGPTITDLPLRQIYYFGDNALDKNAAKRYTMLLSYDDMVNPEFWHELRFTSDLKSTGHGDDLGSHGPQFIDCKKNVAFRRMLKNLIKEVHKLDKNYKLPNPTGAVVMDWTTEPFGGGYHAWKPHYDIVDTQAKIRQPSQFIKDKDYRETFKEAPIYIAGEAYSEDQGWVEGAFCTAESILTDILGATPFEGLNYENYKLVLGTGNEK